MSTGPAPEPATAKAAAGQVMPGDVATDIARGIQDSGEYRLAIDPRDPQRLVDLRWAALEAGRVLGRRVQVVMTKAVHNGDAPITVRLVAPAPRAVVPPQRQHEA